MLELSVRDGERWMNLRYLLEVMGRGGRKELGVGITCQKENGTNIVVHVKNMGRHTHSLTPFEPVTSFFGII